MNVSIIGYVAFTCSHCGQSHTLESEAFAFVEDTSPEADDDEYIRYLAQIDMPCPACASPVQLNLDVWEHPAAVVNYAYYAVQGARDIQCEFSIEHYFDDEAVSQEDTQPAADGDKQGDGDSDEDDKQFNETPDDEVYRDQYDDED